MAAQSKAWTRLPTFVVYVGGLVPAVWYFLAAVNNDLGADPLAALENALGEWALIFLIVGLSISPVLWFLRINLLKYRRALGLVAFVYVVLHFSVYLLLDRQLDWPAIWTDIVKRPYITIGTAAFLLLLPLALTSNNASIRRLGSAAWQRLHRLVYVAALFGAVHYALLKKTWQMEPLLYVLAVVVLIALRLIRRHRRAASRVRHARPV